MTLRALIRLPARVRLAYQLLREYEAERAPMSAAEAMALITSYTVEQELGNWTRVRAPVGASAWRDATVKKAPLYGDAAQP